MLTIFVLLSDARWDARTATNSWCHCAGCTTAKTIKSAMNSNGGNRVELILSRSQGDCGVSVEVWWISLNDGLHSFRGRHAGADCHLALRPLFLLFLLFLL